MVFCQSRIRSARQALAENPRSSTLRPLPETQSVSKGHRMDVPGEFLSAAINAFEANKRLADRAVEQVPDDKLHVALDENTNSIAVIMQHIAGNLLSRWTDFLWTDGEKPWR